MLVFFLIGAFLVVCSDADLGRDSDGDGLVDSLDLDDNGNGILDILDNDDDGDGIFDFNEDDDGDGLSNFGEYLYDICWCGKYKAKSKSFFQRTMTTMAMESWMVMKMTTGMGSSTTWISTTMATEFLTTTSSRESFEHQRTELFS